MICATDRLAEARRKVIETARDFVQHTRAEMDDLQGSQSVSIPVEFMNLHDAVSELDHLEESDS